MLTIPPLNQVSQRKDIFSEQNIQWNFLLAQKLSFIFQCSSLHIDMFIVFDESSVNIWFV